MKKKQLIKLLMEVVQEQKEEILFLKEKLGIKTAEIEEIERFANGKFFPPKAP